MKLVLICLLLLVIFSLKAEVFARSERFIREASEGQINEALQKTVPIRFLPNQTLYFLISIKETFNRFFQPSSVKRAEFDLILSGKRLKETYLLLEKDDTKSASQNLKRYAHRVEKMIGQFEKARSQNQTVETLADLTAENLRSHEILFFAIFEKGKLKDDKFNFDENFEIAVDAFIKSVGAIDSVKPGLRNRFKTVTEAAKLHQQIPPPVFVEPSLLETSPSPSIRPRRIIY